MSIQSLQGHCSPVFVTFLLVGCVLMDVSVHMQERKSEKGLPAWPHQVPNLGWILGTGPGGLPWLFGSGGLGTIMSLCPHWIWHLFS